MIVNGELSFLDRYRLLRGTRAARPTAVGFTGGPSRLVKHESPRASNGAKTTLHGAAQQAIRILLSYSVFFFNFQISFLCRS
jgi:hypothetical protein